MLNSFNERRDRLPVSAVWSQTDLMRPGDERRASAGTHMAASGGVCNRAAHGAESSFRL